MQTQGQVARTARKLTDSSTAPRGEAAVGDCSSHIQATDQVTPVVCENETVQFQAIKRRPAD